jgi:hypothetical protein
VADVRLGGNPHQSLRERDQRFISWIWDGDVDVTLGDPLNGYKAEGKVATVTEVADWLRNQAVRHYPSSEFAEQFAAR